MNAKPHTDYEINDIREALQVAMSNRSYDAVVKYASQLRDAESRNAMWEMGESAKNLPDFCRGIHI